jgi:hypothetical protein
MAMRIALALVLSFSMIHGFAAGCNARSGERTAALVELYTSEGCSSCPPADRWLSGLGARGYVPGRIVPLSLHVDYWDYLGWKDPYAKGEFSGRQRKLTQLQRVALVYTPQVMLQGQDFRGWHTPAFDDAVARINARPARARIQLAIHAMGPKGVDSEVAAELLDAGHAKDAVLYLASYENKLSSQVRSGENSGRKLAHDYVVLEWLGPFPSAQASARSSGGPSRCSQKRSPPTRESSLLCRTGAAPRCSRRSCCRPAVRGKG